MDARTADILEAFGHEVHETDGGFTCDHPFHHGDACETRTECERWCLAAAQDQYEADMLRDGTHPMLSGYDGSGR